MEAATNGQAGELDQAVAELRENPYDLATLYNDFAVKYRVRTGRVTDLHSISVGTVHHDGNAGGRVGVDVCYSWMATADVRLLLAPTSGSIPAAESAAQVWRLCLEMVALGDFNDAAYVRQLWDVHLKSTCALVRTEHEALNPDRSPMMPAGLSAE